MNKRHNEYFAVIIAIAFAALLASGCSTPPQSGNLYEGQTQTMSYGSIATNNGTYGSTATGSAAQSYIQCMNVLTQAGMQQQCYQVSNPYANSYSQYTYTRAGFAKGIGENAKTQAYVSYLSALDGDTAVDMKSQYDALIEQYTK